MDWMFLPYKRYFDFSGRSRRKEYWMFALLWAIVYAVFYVYVFATMPSAEAIQAGAAVGAAGLGVAGIVLTIFALGSLIPAIAVQVRRFHDQDKSGWFVLLNLIPLLGGLIVLVMMCLEGTRGPNRYGPDPLGGEAEVFA